MSDTLSTAFKEELLQCKSSAVYKRWYSRYTEYKSKNGFEDDSIGTFLEFCRETSKTMKVSSLWQGASCINKFLNVEKGINHITHPLFKAYMKKIEANYTPTKSATLNMDNINKFLAESDKSNEKSHRKNW